MIIFGTYYARFKKQPLREVTCPNCGGQDTMYLAAGCRTFHLMFIPFAPGAKRITQRCNACKSEFYPFPEKTEVARRMEAETRKPWYLYFWLWLIGLVVVYGAVMIIIEAFQK